MRCQVGTSKWNKIEHRLFSAVTLNWRGRPLTSHEVVVATINTTRTRRGLSVHAELDEDTYPLGIAISQQELRHSYRSSRTIITGSGTTRSRPPAPELLRSPPTTEPSTGPTPPTTLRM